jgi:hypothetical protein
MSINTAHYEEFSPSAETAGSYFPDFLPIPTTDFVKDVDGECYFIIIRFLCPAFCGKTNTVRFPQAKPMIRFVINLLHELWVKKCRKDESTILEETPSRLESD